MTDRDQLAVESYYSLVVTRFMGMLGALLLFGSCGSKEIKEFF